MKKVVYLCIVLLLAASASHAVVTIDIWHAYRGGEKAAIEKVAENFNLSHNGIQVKLLAVPFDALGDNLRIKIPMNNGPDIFVAAHDGIGSYVENNLILPLEYYLDESVTSQFFKKVLGAFNYLYPDAIWALPGSFKNIALFYNKALVNNPPNTVGEMMRIAKQFTNPNFGQFGKWGFVYETENFYYHTMWVQGFGGKIFRQIGATSSGSPIFLPLIYSQPMIDAGNYVVEKILKQGVCPAQPSGTLVTQLFNTGNALFVVCGQWFRGEIDPRINYGVAKLPIIDERGNRAIPFLTAEGYYMTSCCENQAAAMEVIKYFTSAAMGKVFAEIGKQTPANKGAYQYASVASDPIAQVFMDAASVAVSMPNIPEMALTWGPAGGSLGDIISGTDARTACAARQAELMKSLEEMKGIKYSTFGYSYNNLASREPFSME